VSAAFMAKPDMARTIEKEAGTGPSRQAQGTACALAPASHQLRTRVNEARSLSMSLADRQG